MTPTFTLSVGGQDRTGLVQSRLLSLRVTDAVGPNADELELEFDDRDNALAIPAHGAVLAVAIGYAGAALVDQGRFTVDEDGIEGPPDKVTVKAKSSDVRESLKAHKSRSWRATTVGTIVSQLASESGLAAQTDAGLAGVAVAHRDQANESDLHFLRRLGRDHDAVAMPKGGKLVFVPRGTAVSASGRSLEPLPLARGDLTSWRMRDADRPKYGRVRARHRDPATGRFLTEEAGDADPTKTLRHPHPSAALASSAAHAEHRRLKRSAHEIELELPGEPGAFAGRPVQISGLRDGLNGRWIAREVEHALDFEAGGYTTRITATVDGLDVDTGDGEGGYGGDDADPADTDDSGGGE